MKNLKIVKALMCCLVLSLLFSTVVFAEPSEVTPLAENEYEIVYAVEKTPTGNTRTRSLGALTGWTPFPSGGSFTVEDSESVGLTIGGSVTFDIRKVISALFGVNVGWTKTHSVGININVDPCDWARLCSYTDETEYRVTVRHDVYGDVSKKIIPTHRRGTLIRQYFTYHDTWEPDHVYPFVETK